MKKIETTMFYKMTIVFIIAIFALIFSIVFYVGNTVYEAGGVKNLIIEAGKDIKDISREIEKHE